MSRANETLATPKFNNLVIIKAIINNIECHVLIDTGASVSIIAPQFIKNATIIPTQVNLNCVLGNQLCNQKVHLPIRFPRVSQEFIAPFLVFNIKRNIIGNDILQKLNINISFPKKCISLAGTDIPFYLHSQEINHIASSPSKLKLTTPTILAPSTYTYVTVENPLPNCHFEPSDHLMTSYNVLLTPLYFASAGQVTIPILNPNQYSVKLNSFTNLGDVQEVEEVHHMNFELVPHHLINQVSPSSTTPNITINPNLTTLQRQLIRRLVNQFSDIFATSETDIGTYPGPEKLKIDTDNNPPVHLPPYKKSFSERQTIRDYVQKFLDLGIIQESTSDYAAPVLLVRKRDSDAYRVCIDYRHLHNTMRDQLWPMPRLADIFDTLYNTKFFSKMDISNGYYNFFVDPEDRHKTAFITQDGLYEFIRVPQGLKSSPSFFNKVLRKIFANLLFSKCFLYLDDILVYGDTFETHLSNLRDVFQKLRLNGLKLKPEKCSFGFQEIKILGHVLTADGVKVDPDKVSAVKNMPAPTNVSEVRTFLGCTSYYRRFIFNYASISSPIVNLTKKVTPFIWSKACQKAFDILKHKLMTAPILAQFNEQLPVIIYCDASLNGLGCVLTQQLMNQEHVIAYASRVLNPAEKKYGIAEKECLAVIFALNKFYEYTYGRAVTVVTDHHSLCSLLRTKNSKNLRIARWALEVQQSNLIVKYRKGTLHGNADCLSRLVPLEKSKSTLQSMYTICINSVHTNNATPINYREYILKEQNSDPYYNSIFNMLSSPQVPKKFQCFTVIDNILYYQNYASPVKKLCIPSSMVAEILYAHHDHVIGGGHPGIDRTYLRIKSKFYIPNLKHLIVKYITSCPECSLRNPSNQPAYNHMQPGQIFNTFDKFQIDVIGPLKVTSRHNKYIIVAVDTFSKFVITRAVSEATALSLAYFLIRDIFLIFGIPREIQFDNASINTSKLISTLLNKFNCKAIYITPYVHHSSGLVERTNRSLEEIISKYLDPTQDDWDIILPYATYNLNCNFSLSTGHSPYSLVFGREPSIPLEIALDDVLHKHIIDRNQIRAKARQNLFFHQNQYAKQYNQNRILYNYPLGSSCMIKNYSYKKGLSLKFQSKYIGPFRICKQIDALHYKIKAINPSLKKKYRLVHVERMKRYNQHSSPTLHDLDETMQPTNSTATKTRSLPKRKTTPITMPISTSIPTTYTTRSGRITNKPSNYAA